MTNFPGGDQGR